MYLALKKDLAALPLDLLYQSLAEASSAVEEDIMTTALNLHKKEVAAQIAAIYANKEGSFEGNEEEEFPFVKPDLEYLEAKKALARKTAFTAFADKFALAVNSAWLLPQLFAHIAKIPLVTTPEGRINTMAYAKELMKDDFHKGIWCLGLHPLRGDIVPKQYTLEGRSYCALVPFLLAPHKRFNNISYSSWDRQGLHNLIDPNLYQAMTTEFVVTNTTQELLELRNRGLTVQSGKTAGTVRNAASTHKLYSLSGELKTLPWLAQVMLFQIWCAHPANRSDLMVLDWKDWDSVPESLVPEQLFKAPSVIAKAGSTYRVEKDPYSLF